MKKIFIVIGILLTAINAEATAIEKMANNLARSFKDTNVSQLAIMRVELGEGLTAEDSLNIYNKLFRAFASISGISLIERSQLDKVLGEIKLQASGVVNATDTLKIGSLSKADLLLLSTANKTGSRRVEINARLIEVSSGKVLSADKSEITMDWRYESEEKARKNKSEQKQHIKDIKSWDKIISFYPPDANHYYQRGFLYFSIQEYGSAIQDFTKADALGNLVYPELPFNYFFLGAAYYRLGDYENAIKPLKRVTGFNYSKEGKQSAYGLLIECLRRTNKDLEVIFWATEALNHSLVPEYYHARGYSRLKLGENELALIDLTKAQELGEDTSGDIAWTYFDLGQHDLALDLFNNILASTKSTDVFIGVALSQFRSGNINQAKINFYEAVKLDGRFAGYFDSLGPDYYYTPIEFKALRELYAALNSPRLSEILRTQNDYFIMFRPT